MKDTLGYIVNSRYNRKKVTLITTTLPFEEKPSTGRITPSGEAVPALEKTLSQYGVTFRSRLYEMCRVLEMKSDDYRKAIKQAAYRFHSE